MQPPSSDTTKVLYVLRFRALRFSADGFFIPLTYMFKFLFLRYANSEKRENGIRMPFSCPPDFPGARPHDAPKTPPRYEIL